ncbi:MAG: MmcQ/YjbR family DNA-binding protein [Clostridia bacterium]|nr:MmcQ/YjbR family DNA-binding protein [Clostridia bacterium]
MTLQDLMERALSMPAACVENPFGPDSLCIRIGPHGPIFLNLMPCNLWASFRCEPQQGMVWRTAFPNAVRRGWHCPPVQQPYNNTVTLDGTLPDEVLLAMLEHSYARALRGLSREKQRALGLA